MVRRILFSTFVLLLGLAVAGVVALFGWTKSAEPSYSGEIRLAGVAAPVTVRYGPHAVPSIAAESLEDMFFAQGYVIASERMWQMDLLRRLASGRLAEVFGEEALASDRFFRAIGLPQAARAALDALEEPYRGMLEAYVAGVNAYRTQAAWRYPLEYLIAGFTPAPWRAEDSLAIGEYLAWILSFNVREELVYLRLAARLGPKRAMELFPTDEGIPAPGYARDLPNYTLALDKLDELLAMPARFGLPAPGPASNVWAVNGERTEDGGALLANDPHLAPTVPGIWYELEMRAPGYHAAGVAVPGVPLIVIGHNQDLAWGFTASMADTQDLFVERLTPDGADVVRPGGEQEAIASRTEEIAVKGRAEPDRIEVRSTRNGVVVNDILGLRTGTPMDLATVDTSHLLALRSNLDVPDRLVPGLSRLNTATTLEDARAAVLDFKHASQNLMVAHRDGGIAWQMSGALPVRGRGLGTFPSPGWEKGYGWEGYVPQKRNPGQSNPPGYALLSANNRTIPLDYPVHVSRSWQAPYRAQRIEELLGAKNPLGAADMAAMQLDRVSLQVRSFKAALDHLKPEILEIDRDARHIADEYLMGWDGEFDAGSRSAALFVLLQTALFEALYGDELGDDLPALMSIAIVGYNALEEAVYSERSSFWDDVRTPQREGPAEIWAKALHSAHTELDRRQPELGEQRLSRLRRLSFPHAFDRIPALRRLFSVGPFGVGGDAHTLNTMKASPLAPEEGLIVPSCRVVYTPADWTQTRGTLPLGQSGHRLSRYRTDQLADWMEGRSHPWPWDGPEPGSEIGELVLKPAP